jgi:hypothetical protein
MFIGSYVKHKIFGEGIVKEINNEDNRIHVYFPCYGIRIFLIDTDFLKEVK